MYKEKQIFELVIVIQIIWWPQSFVELSHSQSFFQFYMTICSFSLLFLLLLIIILVVQCFFSVCTPNARTHFLIFTVCLLKKNRMDNEHRYQWPAFLCCCCCCCPFSSLAGIHIQPKNV